MNKKLISLAVGVALATPMAAQAGPKLYGDAHAAIGSVSTKDGSANESTQYVSSASSAWGIKGSDKLGNGMSAIYKMEWNVSLTGDGDNNFTATGKKDTATKRDRFVGIKAGWGTVKIGYFNAPQKIVGRKADMFYSRQLGENRNIVADRGQDARWQSIQYTSPKVNGAQANIMYSPDTGSDDLTDDDENSGFSANVLYKSGNIGLGLGYQKEKLGTATDDRKGLRLMGSYKMGDLKITGLWQNVDQGTVDEDAWSLGASYKMGNNTFKVAYTDRDESSSAAANGASQTSFGIDHKLGKKTIVYFTYAKIDNEANAADRVTESKGFDEGHSTTTGMDPSGFALGMRHKF